MEGKSLKSMENDNEIVLETALDAGVLLMKCGAEMRRVEEVVVHIARTFGINVKETSYSLTNGIMVSYDDDETGTHLSKVRQSPSEKSATRLDILVRVNQLSRDVEKGKYTIEEVREILRKIPEKQEMGVAVRTLFAGLSSFAFVLLLGGGLRETVPAILGGALSYLFVCATENALPRMVRNFMGGILFALISVLYVIAFPGTAFSVEMILGGAMMPLVPGLAFTNGFREFGNGDYLSGTVRLLDALVTFAAMAAGAVLVFRIATALGANVPLGVTPNGYHHLGLQAIFGFLGALTFGVMFQLPWKFTGFAALSGGILWTVYYVCYEPLGLAAAILISTIVLVLVARLLSVLIQCPLTGLLMPGLIPTVPGASLFFMIFYLVNGAFKDSLHYGVNVILICGAIMLGIAIASAVPQKFFNRFGRKK